MIHIRASVSVAGFPSKRSHRAAMMEVHEAQGRLWHSKYLKYHFKPDAPQKYGHAKRSSGYAKWKRKTWETRRPLKNGQYVEGSGVTDNVLSGDMRDMLMRGNTMKVFPTRVNVEMTGPRYVTMRTFNGDLSRALRENWTYGKNRKRFSATRSGRQPDKAKEITATTREERDDLARESDRVLQHFIDTKLHQYAPKRDERGRYTQ